MKPNLSSQTLRLRHGPHGRSPTNRLGRALGGRLTLKVLLATLAILPCPALSIVSPPIFTRATNAPLAGVLQLTTDAPSRIEISVDDGSTVWQRQFFDYSPTHSQPLFGFKPDRTNVITVSAIDRRRNVVTAEQKVTFVTDPLPGDFPKITLFQSNPAAMEPGYSLFVADVFYEENYSSHFYAIILNSDGEVVWYNAPPPAFDIRQRPNGNLFVTSGAGFLEFDLLGQTVHSWTAPIGPVDIHEGLPTDHGTILYLSGATKSVSDFTFSGSDPNSVLASADILYQKVIEMAVTNSALLNTWAPINQLDPRRITYLNAPPVNGQANSGWDTEHSNAVIEDPRDNSLIISMRNQNAVIKFSRTTGQIKWILGPHNNWGPAWQPLLLKPVGTPFAWQYGQHAPVLTPDDTLLLYDNGNLRASPGEDTVSDNQNYSRAVEYHIDEDKMEVSQVWSYGSTTAGDWFYTGFEGNAEPEPKTRNVLINFPAVSYENGALSNPFGPNVYSARFREVTREPVPRVVFDLGLSEYNQPTSTAQNLTVYRVHRIPDLYAHVVRPVTDLAVTVVEESVYLAFSADNVFTHTVESSVNLSNWEPIGTASEDELRPGQFDFVDPEVSKNQIHFYRVVSTMPPQ